MRKMVSLTAVLLLSSAWMLGQGTAQAASSNSSQTNSNANEVTIEGCLSGSAGNYTLTDNSGMSYQLQGETSKLSDQIGHQVQIRGPKRPPPARRPLPLIPPRPAPTALGATHLPVLQGSRPIPRLIRLAVHQQRFSSTLAA